MTQSNCAAFESLESRRLLSVVPHVAQPLKVRAVPGAAGTGITGEYFKGKSLVTPTVIRSDSLINFKWANGRPDQDIPKSFSALWVGQIEPATTDTYTFYTKSDAGTQVIINGVTVINNLTKPYAHGSGQMQLTGGQRYSIQVEYVSRGSGVSRVQLLWSTATMAEQLVPTSVLFPTAENLPNNPPLTGSYYEGTNFNKQLMTRADSSINFNWGTGVPDAALPASSPFTVRWTGAILAPTTGKYTFQSITDDGVRLFVNGVEVIKDWNVHSAQADLGQITLQAGQTYSIVMEYFQDGAGHASAKLLWKLPGKGKNFKFVHFVVPGPATPLNLAVGTASSTQLNLAWSDVLTETGFILERAMVGDTSFTPIATLGQGVTSYADTGLTPATDYRYEIVATNATGDSAASAAVLGTTFPGVVTASVAASGTTATISFTTPGTPTSYVVERSPDGTTGWTAVGTTAQSPLVDSGLTPATTYFYRVTASNAVGSSLPSNVVSVETVTAAVSLAAGVASSTRVNLAWSDVTGETGFIVQESLDGSSNWTQVATVPAGTTQFPVSGLTPATPYYFRVIAVDAGGDSAPSNVASATTSAANPSYATLTTIFGLTGNGLVYSIDSTTGAAVQIGTLSFGTNAAGRDTYTGDFFYLSTSSSTVNISAWNPNDGTNTVINPSVPLSGPVGQAGFRADGDFFVTTSTGELYEINSDTGIATPNGIIHANGSTLATNDGDLAFAPNNTLFIETNSELYSISNAAVNAATATTNIVTATDIGPTHTPNLQIAFGQNGVLYATDATGQLYTLNTSTAAATTVGTPSGFNMGDLASVPLYADLSVAQSASTFVHGGVGTYTLTVNNAGPDTTVGPITVVDTLPAGVTYVSGAGTGWTFSVSGQTVTMTYAQNVPPGASAPAVILNVSIGSSAASSVTNTVTVSTNIFTTNTADGTSTLVTPVSG